MGKFRLALICYHIQMKKIIEEVVRLEKIVGGGQALGALPDGKKIFAWGGLPGETVKIRLTKSKNSYAEGIVTEIIEASPLRIEPRDAGAYLSTSPWQIMNFEAEQSFKSELVREAFALSQIEIATPEISTDGQMFGYRNKMEYSLWWDNEIGQISLAFHIRGTHQKTAISQSSIERPEIFAEACQIVDDMNKRGDCARRYQSLLVRANQNGEVSSALFEKNRPHPKMANLTDSLLGFEYSYSPNGFFQINLPVYELALREIAAAVNSEKVLDMYSGVGTIGLSVARNRKLTLVEIDASAFGEMLKNIPVGSQNIKPIHSRSEEALGFITSDATVILDPPRAGLDEKIVARLAEVQPPQIIYLSCNPATQARDVKLLLEHYKISRMQAFNFFPRTPHIENLVVLEKI